MCLITIVTYTDCLHTRLYYDLTNGHENRRRRGDPTKCKYVRYSENKIHGLCKECLERYGIGGGEGEEAERERVEGQEGK